MRIALLLILAFIATNVYSQTDSSEVANDAYGMTKDSVGIVYKVEKKAGFPGGSLAWKDFLYSNLKADAPLTDLPKHVKNFEQTAIVQFIVCTDGSICDVKVINNVLPSIKNEAERVIKLSGNWIPAEQNGRKVKAYRKQPVTFVIASK